MGMAKEEFSFEKRNGHEKLQGIFNVYLVDIYIYILIEKHMRKSKEG